MCLCIGPQGIATHGAELKDEKVSKIKALKLIAPLNFKKAEQFNSGI